MRDYNFFDIYEKKRGFEFNIKSPYLIGIIIILVCILLSAGLIIRNIMLQNKIEDMTDELLQIQTSDEYIEANELKKSLDAMEKYEANADIALENYKNSNTLNSELLTAIFKGVPANVTLNELYINTTDVEMVFAVPDRKSAATLMLGLEQTNLFHELNLISVETKEGNAEYSANIIGLLKAGVIE